MAEIYFGREVPDVVTRYETFRRVIGVGEGLIHERAEKTYLHHVFPTINSPNLDQVVGGIGGRESVGRPGGELGIEQGYVSVEIELAIRAFRTPVEQGENVQFRRGLESDETGVANILSCGERDARFVGLEAATELDILALFNRGTERPYGQFKFYGNVSLLDAEFSSGPADGFTPPYASNYLIKVGGIYRWKDVVKVGLLGTLVDETFANTNRRKA